jgi:predicted transposase/invertase (TIGR01784 family)
MQVGIDPKVDYAFQRLFGVEHNSALLIDLLNAVLAPIDDERITEVQLLNPFNAKEAWDDKLSIVDVKARDQAGRLFQIEMQMLAHGFLPERLLYYWSRLFAQELKGGEDYSALRPTISICFLNDRLFPEVAEWHLRFEIWDVERWIRLTDALSMHLFELPKFDRPATELSNELERWLYFLRHAEQLDPAQLPATLQVPPITHALEELTVLTHDELERERYEARRKKLLDETSARHEYQRGLQRAHEQALEQGREQGLEQGLLKGRMEGLISRIHFSQRLLSQPLTPVEQLQNESVDELQHKADDLEQQALSR